MPGTYREKGEITGVRQSDDGEHAHVSIAHGKRKPKPKPTKNNPSPGYWDDRRHTEFAIPIAQAEGYTVGEKVTITIKVVEQGKKKEDENYDPSDRSV